MPDTLRITTRHTLGGSPSPFGLDTVGSTVGTGGQTQAAANAAWEALVGRPLKIRRVFHTGVPASFGTSGMQHDQGLRKSVFSFKPTLATPLADLNALAASFATSGHPMDVAIWHEPNDNYSATDFKAIYQYAAPPFRDRGIKTGVIHTNWHYNIGAVEPYWPGDNLCDFAGSDVYPLDDFTTPLETRMQALVDFGIAHNKPIAVGEFGIRVTSDDILGAGWVRSLKDWAVGQTAAGRPPRWLLYFNADIGVAYWLDQQPPVLEAYRELLDVFNTP